MEPFIQNDSSVAPWTTSLLRVLRNEFLSKNGMPASLILKIQSHEVIVFSTLIYNGIVESQEQFLEEWCQLSLTDV